VRDHHAQAKGIGPVPILFVTVGRQAERTVSAFCGVAKELTVPVQGPFGLLSVDANGRRMSVCHWTWLSDFDVPPSSQEMPGGDEALSTTVASLVRTLQSAEPVADPSRPGRIRMSSYVLVDLSEGDSIDRALRMMALLQTAEPAHDMAVVAMTGRTATSGCELDSTWFESWSRLTARLHDELLAQKVYLLDGRTAGGTWFERPEQMDRFCAEFLLQHGITCRGPLRQSERRRVHLQENVLNVCGSFGLRAIALDRTEVIARTTHRLVHEDLAGLYEEILSDERRRQIDAEAQKLAEQIERIHQTPAPTRKGHAEQSGATPDEPGARNKAVCEAIGHAVARVCDRTALVSLCHLLECLEPKLRRLLTRQKLLDRQRIRKLVADALQQRDQRTYQPMRVWLDNPNAGWVDRFTPAANPRPRVAVSRPATEAAWRTGFGFLMVGLLCLGAGLFVQDRAFALGGVLVSLAAAVLATQPSGWSEHSRTMVPEGCRIDESIPVVCYRKRPRLWMRCLAVAMAVLGAIAVAWSLWPDLWSAATVLRAGAALLAVVGVSVILTGPVQVRPDQAKHHDAPDHLCPPFWTWRAFGLLCLAASWLILCLRAPSPFGGDAVLRWACYAAGVVLVGTAAVLGLRPHVGRVHLIERIPEVPKPLRGGITATATNNDMIHRVGAIIQWIDHLTLNPQQALLRHGMPNPTQGHEVLFDFIAIDWDRQLAQTFRETLRSRMDQSLRDLTVEPKAWAQCVIRHLQDAQGSSPDLGVLFAGEVVRVWVNSLSSADLARCLNTVGDRAAQLLSRSASPNWPATRVEPNVNVCIVAVGSAIWDALKPLALVDGAPLLVRRNWDAHVDDALVLRIVQGLPQGWRGYPALPTQIDPFRRPNARDAGAAPPSQASSRAS